MPDKIDSGSANTTNDFYDGLLVAVAFVGFMAAGLGLVVFLNDVPHEELYLIAYMHASFVILLTFFHVRGFDRGYSLNLKAVRSQLSKLFSIHLLFLALVLAGYMGIEASRVHFPESWVHEDSRHRSPFVLLLICAFSVVVMAQVLLSRRILQRSEDAERNTMMDELQP